MNQNKSMIYTNKNKTYLIVNKLMIIEKGDDLSKEMKKFQVNKINYLIGQYLKSIIGVHFFMKCY